jgi:Flp pilus assembly protein TadG
MIQNAPPCHPGAKRPGRALVMFVLLMPVLLGMVGLTIDTGLLLVVYRQTQNAADAAALAAAVDLLNGKTSAAATTTGTSYVQSYNNMSGATVTINIGPASGPHAGNSDYAEAIVSYPYTTSFIQVLGVSSSQTVTARAVGGYEAVSSGAGVITLNQNPQGNKGLQVSGGASLSVNGAIAVNATDPNLALDVSGGGNIYAQSVNVSGGAAGSSNVLSYPSGGGPSPLSQNTGVNEPDPLANLPVPTTSSAGTYKVVNTSYGNVSISSGTTTLSPGIYTSLSITGGTVLLNPGIYVIQGGQGNTGLNITGGSVTGLDGVSPAQVMFYNTSATYNPATGVDATTKNSDFATIGVAGIGVKLSGLNDSTSPFNGILFYQDRNNTQSINIAGGTNGATVNGTTYAPNASLQVSGQGTWNSQFIVSDLSVTGTGTVTLNYSGQNLGKANEVFLVE